MKKHIRSAAVVFAALIALAVLNGCGKPEGIEPDPKPEQTEQTEKAVSEDSPIAEEPEEEVVSDELPVDTAAEQPSLKLWDGNSKTTDDGMTVTLTVGEDSDSFESFFGADKSDVNFDLIWSAQTDPAAVTLAFYPGQFPTQKTLREELYDSLCGLPIPAATDTDDLTNAPEVRDAAARVFRVTQNGDPVSGDLYRSQGNGHVDFTFRFDGDFTVKAGDVLVITVRCEG